MTDDDEQQGGHWVEDTTDKEDTDEKIKLSGSLIKPLTIIRRL